jgi:hypothetical protein
VNNPTTPARQQPTEKPAKKVLAFQGQEAEIPDNEPHGKAMNRGASKAIPYQ